MKTKILVSLTTLDNPDWQRNLADLKRFGIKEFAIFPNCINSREERMELFESVIRELGQVSIPFSHIRADMHPDEIDFMVKNFNTKAVNIHPTSEWPTTYDLSNYKDIIYVENAGPAFWNGLTDKDIEGFAGVCLDLSHLESVRLQKVAGYDVNINISKKYKIGANHMSAMTDKLTEVPQYNSATYDNHYLSDLKEMDYIKQYYPKYFGPYAAIELKNSIEDQIKIKDYVEKMLFS